MNIQEARNAIRDDSIGPVGWAMAASVIAEAPVEGTETLLLEDMLIALTRGELAASTAICVLHGKTGRPWPEPNKVGYRDAEEWRSYLKERSFL